MIMCSHGNITLLVSIQRGRRCSEGNCCTTLWSREFNICSKCCKKVLQPPIPAPNRSSPVVVGGCCSKSWGRPRSRRAAAAVREPACGPDRDLEEDTTRGLWDDHLYVCVRFLLVIVSQEDVSFRCCTSSIRYPFCALTKGALHRPGKVCILTVTVVCWMIRLSQLIYTRDSCAKKHTTKTDFPLHSASYNPLLVLTRSVGGRAGPTQRPAVHSGRQTGILFALPCSLFRVRLYLRCVVVMRAAHFVRSDVHQGLTCGKYSVEMCFSIKIPVIFMKDRDADLNR